MPPGCSGAGLPENRVTARSKLPQKKCTGLALPRKPVRKREKTACVDSRMRQKRLACSGTIRGWTLSLSNEVPSAISHGRVVIGVSSPFWQATAKGRLVLPFCQDCRQYHWYPRAVCPHCHGQNLHWRHSDGYGIIHSLAVMYRLSPPKAAAIVQLDEGICVYTVIRDAEAGALSIGQLSRPLRRQVPRWYSGR